MEKKYVKINFMNVRLTQFLEFLVYYILIENMHVRILLEDYETAGVFT